MGERMHSCRVRMVGVALVLLAVSGCLDLTVPAAPPPPGPGTLQGTVVYAVPGRVGSRPAGGARVALMNSSVETTANDETGRFLLTGLTESSGQVLVTFDSDGDGVTDRQKSINLQTVKAGPGRDIELGEVPLGRNATVSGKALRGDLSVPSGHAGTSVFISGSPFLTNTADDGSFTLNDLPEGPATLSFFRINYLLETRELTLKGGEESRVAAVSLERAQADQAAVSRVTGSVRLSSGAAADSARVSIAGNGALLTVATGSAGQFAFESVPSGVYQFAIERDATLTLRLTNVVVATSETALGTFTLQPGVSTPAALDAGFEPEPEGVGAAARAVNDVVAPGRVATLSAVGSSGKAPLRFHWSFDTSGLTDPGVLPVFGANDSTSASTTTFTAPATPQRLRVLLTVTDALNRSATSMVANVFVGSRPIARITGPVSSSVTSGSSITLDASGSTSPDGSPITHYRWSQLGGEPVQNLAADIIAQTVLAPRVPSPVTLGLIVETSIGIASEPVEITIVATQAGAAVASFTVTPAGVIHVTQADTIVVSLRATVANAPAGATIEYRWNVPWLDNSMPRTTARVEVFAPKADRNDTVTLAVKVNGVALPLVSSTIQFVDDSTPMCNASLTQLSFRYSCDRPLGPNAALVTGPAFSDPLVYESNREFIVRFSTPLALNTPVTISLTGLTQASSGTSIPDVETTLMVNPGTSSYYRSLRTSLDEPRPGWVSVWYNGASRDQITGRRVAALPDGGLTRAAWALESRFDCSGMAPCLLDDADAGMAPIPGAGTTPNGKTVFNTSGAAYVVLSSGGPGSIAALDLTMPANLGFSELADTQPFLALGSDGSTLSKFSIKTPGMGLQRSVLGFAKTWAIQNETFASVTYSATSPVAADFQVGLAPVVASIDQANLVKLQSLTPGITTWAEQTVTSSLATGVRVVSLDDARRHVVFTRLDGTLWLCEVTSSSSCAQLFAAPVEGFDAIRWGTTTMVAFAYNGFMNAGLVNAQANTLIAIKADMSNKEFNIGTLPLPATQPQLQPVNGEVSFSWQEQDGATWHMAGRRLR